MARGADLDNVEGKHLGGKVLGRRVEARRQEIHCGGEGDGCKKVDLGGRNQDQLYKPCHRDS